MESLRDKGAFDVTYLHLRHLPIIQRFHLYQSTGYIGNHFNKSNIHQAAESIT